MPLWYNYRMTYFSKDNAHYPYYVRCVFFEPQGHLKKGKAMAISSVNFQKAKSNSVAETTREFEAKYLLPKEHRGENEFYNCGTDENILFEQELEKAERKGGRIPKLENSLWEGLLNLNKNHTIEDVNRVGEHIAKKFNFHYTRGALHRDEGHINKKGKVEYNYHAHINFMTYKDGKQNWRLEFIDKEALRELQTEVANLLGMERGEFNSKSVRANHRVFREKAEEIKNSRLNQKEIAKLREENQALKSENEALKIDNEALKYSKKELENQIKDLSKNLRENLKELGALRPQYAELENLNKELKEELKNNALKHETVVKSYQDLELKLRNELTKKDEKIDNLAAENEDLKSEIEALKYQLDLKEKRNQAYFGLNQDLKAEINSLKEQINALEASNEDLEEKVIDLEEKIDSKANMSDFKKGEQFLQELTDKYSNAGTGRDKSDSSSFNKIKEVQANSKREKLLNAFSRIEEERKELKQEQSKENEATKKRSFRER